MHSSHERRMLLHDDKSELLGPRGLHRVPSLGSTDYLGSDHHGRDPVSLTQDAWAKGKAKGQAKGDAKGEGLGTYIHECVQSAGMRSLIGQCRQVTLLCTSPFQLMPSLTDTDKQTQTHTPAQMQICARRRSTSLARSNKNMKRTHRKAERVTSRIVGVTLWEVK